MEEWQMSIDPKIERPGLPIECVRRAAEGQIVEMTPPNQTRHSYPSA
jgi:hypothetical protein